LDKLSFIKKLFYDASNTEIQTIDNSSRIIEINEKIETQDSSTNYLYIVMTGFVKLYTLNSKGAKFILDVLGPNDFFGEGTLLETKLYDYHTFIGDAKILKIDFRDIRENIFKECPKLSNFIFTETLIRIQKMTQRMQILLGDAEVKVAKSLIFFANSYGIRENGHIKLHIPDQREFANFADCSRETVSRMLNKFASQDLIEYVKFRGTDITIKDYNSFLNHYN
jgi:CRP-like cAMP-binding protein